MIAAPAIGFRAAVSSLFAAFGDRISLARDGDSVVWECDDRRVVVALQPDGAAVATFLDAPVTDAVSGLPVRAAYRGAAAYRLSTDGARRMAGDVASFFAGTREPSFTFFAAVDAA